jgi:hypothetical protein
MRTGPGIWYGDPLHHGRGAGVDYGAGRPGHQPQAVNRYPEGYAVEWDFAAR